MSDLREAYKKLKAANPLAAALVTSGQLRATVYGLALIDRALEPTADEPTAEDYSELNEIKPTERGEDQ